MIVTRNEFSQLCPQDVSRVQYKVLWGNPAYRRRTLENLFFSSNGFVKDAVDQKNFKIPEDQMRSFYAAVLSLLAQSDESDSEADDRWCDGKVYVTLRDNRRVSYCRMTGDGSRTLRMLVECFMNSVQHVNEVVYCD